MQRVEADPQVLANCLTVLMQVAIFPCIYVSYGAFKLTHAYTVIALELLDAGPTCFLPLFEIKHIQV
jgi:hypothetical protein